MYYNFTLEIVPYFTVNSPLVPSLSVFPLPPSSSAPSSPVSPLHVLIKITAILPETGDLFLMKKFPSSTLAFNGYQP